MQHRIRLGGSQQRNIGLFQVAVLFTLLAMMTLLATDHCVIASVQVNKDMVQLARVLVRLHWVSAPDRPQIPQSAIPPDGNDLTSIERSLSKVASRAEDCAAVSRNLARIHLISGDRAYSLGDFSQAIDAYYAAVSVAPRPLPIVLRTIGTVLARNEQRTAEGLQVLRDALAIDPDDAVTREVMASIYLYGLDKAEFCRAIHVLEPLVGKRQHPYLYALLATAYNGTGEWFKAAEAARKGLALATGQGRLSDMPGLYYLLGQSYACLRKTRDAELAWRAALAIAPDYDPVLRALSNPDTVLCRPEKCR